MTIYWIVWCIYGISCNIIDTLWNLYGMSIEYHGLVWISMAYLWNITQYHRISGKSNGTSWNIYGMSWNLYEHLRNLLECRGISVESLWEYLWNMYGISWNIDANIYGIDMKHHWIYIYIYIYGISMEYLVISWNI